jgi:hypothetical protein
MRVDDLAVAARDLRALDLRMMWRELLEAGIDVSSIPPPDTADTELRAIAASLVELLAARLDQAPPAWAADVTPLDHSLLLVTARTSARRERLAQESPEPLRKRGLLAPAGYLTMA